MCRDPSQKIVPVGLRAEFDVTRLRATVVREGRELLVLRAGLGVASGALVELGTLGQSIVR